MAFIYVVIPPEIAATEGLMTFEDRTGTTPGLFNPVGFVWPNTLNTGPRVDVFTDYTDSDEFTIDVEGTEIAEMRFVNAKLRILAKDVWIHDCIIEGDGNSDKTIIYNAWGHDANLLVEYCQIGKPDSGNRGSLCIGTGGYTMHHCRLIGTTDYCRMGDGDTTVEYCLMHDRVGVPLDHGDGVQIFTGNHTDERTYLVKDSVLECTTMETSAFFGADGWVGTFTSEHNWWSGGNVTWRLHESGDYVFIDNEVEWEAWFPDGLGFLYDNVVGTVTWSNNHWVTHLPGSDRFTDPDTLSTEVPAAATGVFNFGPPGL